MQSGGDFSQLEELISGDSSVIGEFLAAPVSLKTNQVYKIENYGSSMAPFYSTLSIWIGGIVLVAMLKTGVSTKCTEGLKKVKPHQEYLGRYLIFLIVGLLQSTLICLGDLLYLGIQCKHPFLFMLAGMVLEHRICEYHLYTDGVIRRYRKSSQCCTSGHAGGRFRRNIPD